MTKAVDIADAGHQLVAWVNFNGGFADVINKSGNYQCSNQIITITSNAHTLTVGDSINAAFSRTGGDTTPITDEFFVILTVPDSNTFTIKTVASTTDQSGTVTFDGSTLTLAYSTLGPIRNSSNISSITDLSSTGHFKVNFETPLDNVDYCFVGSAYDATSNNVFSCVGFAQVPSTTEFYVYVYDFSGNPSNVKYVYCAFFNKS